MIVLIHISISWFGGRSGVTLALLDVYHKVQEWYP